MVMYIHITCNCTCDGVEGRTQKCLSKAKTKRGIGERQISSQEKGKVFQRIAQEREIEIELEQESASKNSSYISESVMVHCHQSFIISYIYGAGSPDLQIFYVCGVISLLLSILSFILPASMAYLWYSWTLHHHALYRVLVLIILHRGLVLSCSATVHTVYIRYHYR